MGAPDNELLRHIEGFHAKLYLSDTGLIVTSANASNRGIGFSEGALLTECGTFHKAGSTVYNDAARWFDQIWLEANVVDDGELHAAKLAWTKRQRRGMPEQISDAGSADSLLRRIAANPDAHRGIGVVFTSGEAEDGDVTEASTAAIEADDALEYPNLTAADRRHLASWHKGHLFTGWSDAEMNAWPRTFLCAHRGKRGAVTYWCYDRFAEARLDEDEWSLFASLSSDLRSKLNVTASPRAAAKPEDELLAQIFELLDRRSDVEQGGGHRLCESPCHLAELLAEVIDQN